MSDLERLYIDKPAYYSSFPREDIVQAVKGSDLTVLEIGCGTGGTGKRLLETSKAKWVAGIELMEYQAEMARNVLNEVLVGDVSEIQFPWNAETFDCIIAADVLEHLSDPWLVLERLRPFLKPDGIFISTIPNVRYFPVVWDLLIHGEWYYQNEGVLDKTHYRFFTRRSAVRLFRESGYVVISAKPCFWRRKIAYLNRLTFNSFKEIFALRWLIVAKRDLYLSKNTDREAIKSKRPSFWYSFPRGCFILSGV